MTVAPRRQSIAFDGNAEGSSALVNWLSIPFQQRPILTPLIVTLIFFLLCLPNLDSPAALYFDEQIYIKAAQDLGENRVINREHPMLAKEIMAGFLNVFGSNWASIRLGSVVWGALGLFGFQIAVYRFTRSQIATAIFGLLVTGNCLLLTTSRMAMLDPFMIGFGGLSTAFFASGMTMDQRRLINFVLAGAAMGLALASKWSIAPFAACLGLAILLRFREDLRAACLYGAAYGIAAALAYIPTFAPLLFDARHPLTVGDFVILHRVMAERLGLLLVDHPYTSEWWHWPFGGGQMWLYDGYYNGGDKRIIILGQNPVAAIFSIPAVIWGLRRGLKQGEWVLGGASLSYLTILVFWLVTNKPIMFLYHYNIASILSLFIAAVALSRMLMGPWQKTVLASMLAYFLLFAWTIPAISGIGNVNVRPYYRDLPLWSLNPEARGFAATVGNANELGLWSDGCLDNPRLDGCLDHRRNDLQ